MKENAASGKKLQTVIPVLGMHHCGTLLVSQLLSRLGMALEHPVEPTGIDLITDTLASDLDIANGYFGSINSELLKLTNCDPSGFDAPQKLLTAESLCGRITIDEFRRQEIARFISLHFPTGSWGWGDPRSVLTFGFWQRILVELNFNNLKPVIIVRHPADVANIMTATAVASTGQHMGLQRLQHMALEVWLVYHRILWQYCRRHPWLVCTYESLTDPEIAINESLRIALACGLDDSSAEIAAKFIVQTEGDRTKGQQSSEVSILNEAIELYQRFKRIAAPTRFQMTEHAMDSDESRLLHKAQLLKDSGRIDAAVELLTKGLEIRPQYRAARFLLSYTLMETGYIARSAHESQWLIETQPDDPVGYGLLAFGLTQQARIDEAIQAFRKCLRCRPNNGVAWSNLLFASLYSDSLSDKEVTALHIEAASAIRNSGQVQPFNCLLETPRAKSHSGEQPLRIGYLSADLKKHPVGYFLRSLLQNHDRQRFHVSCYHTSCVGDDLTTTLRSQCDDWCEAHAMNDDQLTQQIRGDAVDILIDLSGHSSGNRCGVILRRAAPVQALYLGYPATSGLPEMDYVISDAHISPPELDHLYTERLARLEHSFLCFHPYDDAPAVVAAPCQSKGFVTFGSFNNLPKISRSTVALWSGILKAVADSRLVIKALSFTDADTRELFHRQFAEQGIERSRIDLLPPTVPLAKFLAEYGRIDIGLDPTPYNGGTTTCEALWMGVPVITLPGSLFCSRMGLSILRTLGLEDWIAQSNDDYIQIAAQLAAQPTLIASHRMSLRERMRNSQLCNGRQFTADFEKLCGWMFSQRAISSL